MYESGIQYAPYGTATQTAHNGAAHAGSDGAAIKAARLQKLTDAFINDVLACIKSESPKQPYTDPQIIELLKPKYEGYDRRHIALVRRMHNIDQWFNRGDL